MVISDAHDDCSYRETTFYDAKDEAKKHHVWSLRKALPVKKKKLEQKPDPNQVRLLAQLVEAEAGTQGYHGKLLVANVVLNRVRSDRFPDTIWDVIHQRYQFSVIGDGRFNRMASRISKESIAVATDALKGACLDRGILYFNSGPYCMNGRSAWKYKDHWFAY